MSRNVTGPLSLPSGELFASVKIRIRSVRHNNSANGFSPIHSETVLTINAIGEFTTNLLDGDYEVHLQYEQRWQALGIIVIDPAELGTVTLGELIDQYRDATADYSPSGLATQTWVQNYVGVGGSPADISLTAFKALPTEVGKFVRQRLDGLGIEYHAITPQEVQVQYEVASHNQLLQVGHDYYFTPGHTYTAPSAPNGGHIGYAWLGDPSANPVTLNMNGKRFNDNTDATTQLDIYLAGRLIDTNTLKGWTI